jgi:DNA-binding NarL/FixJ family response regulator
MGATVARERELEAIAAFLDLDGPPGGRALLLEGEAGIGKSALWRTGTATASARGYRVLSCAAAESETQLAFTTLRDLLADAFDEVSGELPPPQRHALAVALLREEPTSRPPQPANVAVAFLSALRSLASRTPTLLAIDDVQWVDDASVAVLQYALRRLEAAHVDALLACRTADGTEPPPIREALAALDGLQVLEVGPFSVGAVGRLLHERLGMTLPRPTLRRVHATSGGNALYALEIARAITETSTARTGEPLPLPGNLLQLVKQRVGSLPADTFDALAFASALSRPTLELVSAALGSDATAPLEPAIRMEIVHTDGPAVRFSHPLFAASVYALAGLLRPAIHARLADVVVDPEERARHLAHATEEPDVRVARLVAAGAARAFSRGAPAAAAELAAQARRLTPPEEPEAIWEQALAESEYAFAAGDSGRAAALLDDLAERTPPGPRHARLLSSQARLRHFDRNISASVVLQRRALEEVGDDSALRGEIEEGLAWGMLLLRTDLVAASRHARSACALAEQRGDAAALAEGLAVTGLIDFVLGRDWERTMGQALSLEEATLELRVLRHPSFAYGYCLSCADELDEARCVFEELLQRSAHAGDESSVPSILNHLTHVECLAGRWQEASALADECHERALESGQQPTQHSILGKQALLAAQRGAVDEAREIAWCALAPIGGQGFDPARPAEAMANGGETAVSALGLLELTLGNYAEAHRLLGPLCAELIAAGIQEPGEMRCLPDEIEALVALGRLEEADELATRLEGWARRLGRPSALAAAARCRGLLLAAQDDLSAALATLDQAVAAYEGVPLPFERGRALLALGSVQRRKRRRREARETLAVALGVFEELGAALCAQQARAELSRIGGRSPHSHELTPSEQRIAALVAEGKTNKEVAAALVVANRTVESALTQIYRKLDVRSRTELARKLAPPA